MQYRNIEAIRQKLWEEAEQNLFASGFEKKSSNCEKKVLCSLCLRDAKKALKEQIEESYNEVFSQLI